MYPHFIQVHDKEDGAPFSVNIDHIVTFGNSGIILSSIPNDIALGTAESYDELKQLIEDSGALIQMGDPRLDTQHPLTIDNLRKMIGEPVWKSNNGLWMLVEDIKFDDDYRGPVVILRCNDGSQWHYDEEDLLKFPFYRIRRDLL